MATLGNAYVTVKADTKDLEPGLNTAKTQTSSASDSMARSFRKAALAAAAIGGAAVFAAKQAITKSIELANEQEAVERRLAAVIKSTGKAAGFSAEEMYAMASGFQAVTKFGDETVISGMSVLATFKNIKGEGFERATSAALDMSEVMQQDLQSAIVMIGKALNDPIANLSAMSRAGVQFTKDQKEMIKELWIAGDAMGAQSIILDELEGQFGGAAEAARGTFGGAVEATSNAFGDLLEEVGFVITKNEAFIEVVSDVEELLIDVTKNVGLWREANEDLVSNGLEILIDNIKTTIFVLEELGRISDTILTPFRQIETAYIDAAGALGDFFGAVGQVIGGVRGLDGELNTTRNGAQVFVGTIDDARFSQESLNAELNNAGPSAQTARDGLSIYSTDGQGLLTDLWRTHGDESEAADARANAAIADQQQKLEAYVEAGKALGADLWLVHAEEAELAMSRANVALAIQAGEIEIYKNEGAKLGEDLWLVHAEESEAAAQRAKDAVIDVGQELEDYAIAGKELGEDMWLAHAEGSEAAKDRAIIAIEEQEKKLGILGFSSESSGFFAGINKAWEDMVGPNGSMTTWADTGEAIVESFTDSTQEALSDSLINWMTGEEGVTINTAWETFWQGMLGTVVDYVAKMVAEWATVELLKGASTVIDIITAETGAYDVPEDMMMWVHAGEMVVPADTANTIRSSLGSDSVNISEFSPTFNAEAGMDFAADYVRGIVGRYLQGTIAGGALVAGGYIDAGQLAEALTSLDFAGLTLRNSYIGALKQSLGLTGSWAKIGSAAGKAGALFGGFGPLASIFGIGGAVMGDALGDLANMRENEQMRDFLEDMHGYISGRVQYRQLAEWMYGKGDYGSDSDWRPTGDGGVIISQPGVGDIIINEPGSAGDPRPPGSSNGGGGGPSDSDIDWDSPSDERPDFARGGFVDRLWSLGPNDRSGEDGWARLQFGETVLTRNETKDMAGLLRQIRDDGRKARRGQVSEIGQVDVDAWMTKRIKSQQDNGLGYKFVQVSPISAGM